MTRRAHRNALRRRNLNRKAKNEVAPQMIEREEKSSCGLGSW